MKFSFNSDPSSYYFMNRYIPIYSEVYLKFSFPSHSNYMMHLPFCNICRQGKRLQDAFSNDNMFSGKQGTE